MPVHKLYFILQKEILMSPAVGHDWNCQTFKEDTEMVFEMGSDIRAI